MYQNFEDPWHQSNFDHIYDTRRQLAISWAQRLRDQFNSTKTVELGCGFGHLTEFLRNNNFSAAGLDVSKTTIEKARQLYLDGNYVVGEFNDFKIISKIDPDIFIMAEITWCVLDYLD